MAEQLNAPAGIGSGYSASFENNCPGSTPITRAISSYLVDVKDANWQHRVISVADGGAHYWCAIYVKGMQRHFVTFKKEGGGDGEMHVSFNGEA
jgi:hypothetical protein